MAREKEEVEYDDVYDVKRALRPTKPPPKWRTEGSTSEQRRKLVQYCDDLEDIIAYYQQTMTKTWLHLHKIRKGEAPPESVTDFINSLEGITYRKRNAK